MNNIVLKGAAAILMLSVAASASAKVSAEEAAKLGKELTDVGAVRAGNKDGSIPAWTGKSSFSPKMLSITRDQLEDLRKRLVHDIDGIVTDPKAVGEVLALGQDIMDSDPAKFQQVMKLVREMLTADGKLKADIDRVLATRGGKSMDGLLAQVEQRAVKLPALQGDIAAVLTSLKKDKAAFSRMVAALDVGKALELSALVDSKTKGRSSADLMLAYMPSYVKDFLTYKVGDKPSEYYMKPLYVITRDNMAQHADKLTEGHKALFKTYADYKMVVFPTVRNAFFPEEILKATVANATRATLNGTDDVQGAELGFPFPIPKSGAEPLWNHKLKFRGSAVRRYNNQAIVKPDGSYKISKLVEDVKFKYANLAEPAKLDKKGIFAYYMMEVISPPRVAGQITLVHETAGGAGNSRVAYLYSPGLGRVNRAPDVGYDNPSIGSDGEQFNDQIDVFNGAQDRADWKLVGKREILIPYNSWVLNSPTFKYKDIIRPGHINQDLARYELHRVWVVEATLRAGQRHRFGKRRFYIDEDSWSIAAVDCYDNRGELWKVQESHLLTVPFIPTVSGIPETIYDLQSKRYFVTALSNEDAITDFEIKFSDDQFTPNALQAKSRSR
jgi:hypothetical protein